MLEGGCRELRSRAGVNKDTRKQLGEARLLSYHSTIRKEREPGTNQVT